MMKSTVIANVSPEVNYEYALRGLFAKNTLFDTNVSISFQRKIFEISLSNRYLMVFHVKNLMMPFFLCSLQRETARKPVHKTKMAAPFLIKHSS